MPRDLLEPYTEAQAREVFAVAMPARHLSPTRLTAREAAALVLAREISSQSFRWFIAYVTADDVEPYQFDAFHLAIIAELQAVYDKTEKRLLLAAPPRHGKSKLCAILFPCFILGNRPQAKAIIAAYNQELAREHLREARAILLSAAFKEVFPGCELAEDGMAADLLRTKQEGSCRATGAGGILTGLGADLLVLDDLIKGYDEAQSELVRSSLWSWYATSARTRLSPAGAIVAIGTRWHHDDVLGRLVKASEDGTGERWHHASFPAINREGVALWAARFPVEALSSLKATLGVTQWQALFQGSPSPVGGGFLRAAWFPNFLPENLGRDLLHVLCTDFALSEAAGDWSVIALVAIDPDGEIYLREMWRERVTMDRTVTALISICAKWRPTAWCYENDAIMQSALPLIRQRMQKAGINVWHIQHSRQASKVQKAGPLQGILEERGMHVPVGAPWVDDLLREVEEFPAGQHDDQVDALAHLGRAWLKLRPRAATPEGPPGTAAWGVVESRQGGGAGSPAAGVGGLVCGGVWAEADGEVEPDMKPCAIDLFCGLGGWTEGLLAEGWDVVGFDLERHAYGEHAYPAQLVLQDVLTLHGSQFRAADLIVGSPPCQEFSYMAMPWTRAKAKIVEIEACPTQWLRLCALFDACFRIQREACEAAGRHIPLIVENVRGAQKWVGRSRWNYGSFHLWGDVPALMPMTKRLAKVGGIDFNGYGTPGYKAQAFNGTAESRLRQATEDGRGGNLVGAAMRGAASAMIAKIPLPLAQYIAHTFRPQRRAA